MCIFTCTVAPVTIAINGSWYMTQFRVYTTKRKRQKKQLRPIKATEMASGTSHRASLQGSMMPRFSKSPEKTMEVEYM